MRKSIILLALVLASCKNLSDSFDMNVYDASFRSCISNMPKLNDLNSYGVYTDNCNHNAAVAARVKAL